MRIFNFIVPMIGIVILSLVFLFTALFIKCALLSPAIYSQKRVGRNGRLFSLYKFRTMVVNADRIGTSVTTGKDPRITKVGRILRKTKLDELPQLWDILKGYMSFVGLHVDMFEKEFCEITGARFATAVSSKIAAIHLALILLVIQRRRLNQEGKIPCNTGKVPCPPIISILILVIITG